MKMTINIDDALFKKASELTGVTEKAALVRMSLEALISGESARRLAALLSLQPDLDANYKHKEQQEQGEELLSHHE